MKKPNQIRLNFTFLMFALIITPAFAYEPDPSADLNKKFSVNLSSELVSRYVWRGSAEDMHPHLQGSLLLNYGNLSFEAWGTSGLTSGFSEIDLVLAYQAGPLAFAITDYFVFNDQDLPNANFFNFKTKDDEWTNHAVEGSVVYEGSDAFPIMITAGTFFFGNDKDADNKNLYSTYLEMAYQTVWKNYDILFFLGGTTHKGLYADNAAITNVGMKTVRTVKMNENLKLALSSSLIVNPDLGHVFLVFGIGL